MAYQKEASIYVDVNIFVQPWYTLTGDQWLLIVGVGFFVILSGEIDKVIIRWRKSYIGLIRLYFTILKK